MLHLNYSSALVTCSAASTWASSENTACQLSCFRGHFVLIFIHKRKLSCITLGICIPTHPSPFTIMLSNGGDMYINLHQKVRRSTCSLYRSKDFYFLLVSVGVLDANTVQIASPKTWGNRTPSLSY